MLISFVQCRDLFLHPAGRSGPRTIFPPTPEQYDALITFLLAPSTGTECPLPIPATSANRWRYDPWDCMTRFNIFRDCFERNQGTGLDEPVRNSSSAVDWPELDDVDMVVGLQKDAQAGGTLDQAAMAAALGRLKQITPSSPIWRDWGEPGDA
jgi:hypothetical protein